MTERTNRCQGCNRDLPRWAFPVKPGAARRDRQCAECQERMPRNLPKPPKPPRQKTGPKRKLQYVINPETGCWDWQLAKDRDGYGRGPDGHGKTVRAHRMYYEARFGPLPDGWVPDHCCPHGPNRGCVNPDHMRARTLEDNSRYKGSTKLTRSAAAEIRALAGTMSQREIAERFGVGQAQISRIINGIRWNT